MWYDLLCSFLLDRPATNPQTASSSLVPEATPGVGLAAPSSPQPGTSAASSCLAVDEALPEPEVSLSICDPPPTKKRKHTNLKPPSHAHRMESLYRESMKETREGRERLEKMLGDYLKASLENQRHLLEIEEEKLKLMKERMKKDDQK